MKLRNKTPILPAPHLVRMEELGLRVVCFRDTAVNVSLGNGESRSEWLPKHVIGNDGKTLITWETDNTYVFAGWQPWHDGMFGGRYGDIHGALNWIQRARDVRSGKASNFLGV